MLPWRGLRCQTRSLYPERITRRVQFPSKHIYQARYKHDHHAQDGGHRPPTVAIIGSGPAGFYTAQKLMRDINGTAVDMYEQLPVPFGLVRFGVAPDHPEVKNCQDTFNDVASSPNYKFIGNISLGHDLPLQVLAKHYDAIVFAYGASKDSKLGLEGENKPHVYSARAFVGWYNGLPEYRNLDPDLSAGEHAIVIGQGNVALDVARILLEDIEVLRKTDITSHALEALSISRIKHVRVVGRRGPLQAAFTIKEVRELMQLPDVNFTPIPDSLLPADLSNLPRPKKRLLELLKKGSPAKPCAQKSWSLDFLLSPTVLEFSSTDPPHLTGVTFTRNTLLDPDSSSSTIQPTSEHTSLRTSTLFRSIGYKATPIPGTSEIGALFDEKTGTLAHDGTGRILRHNAKQHNNTTTPRLYCSGWVKRGPTGVIASTMTDAFETAEAIVADWRSAYSSPNPNTTPIPTNSTSTLTNKTPAQPKLGWEAVKASAQQQNIPLDPVYWSDWEKIDAVERREGSEKGKPREKRTTVQGMLDARTEREG